MAENTDCDITRSQTFSEIQNLILRSVLESGDIFIIKRTVPRSNKLIDLSLQLVEADRVSNPDYKTNTEKLIAGVEVDKNGAPIAYHICGSHPDDYQSEKSKKYVKITAFDKYDNRQIFHIFNRIRPGLTR